MDHRRHNMTTVTHICGDSRLTTTHCHSRLTTTHDSRLTAPCDDTRQNDSNDRLLPAPFALRFIDGLQQLSTYGNSRELTTQQRPHTIALERYRKLESLCFCSRRRRMRKNILVSHDYLEASELMRLSPDLHFQHLPPLPESSLSATVVPQPRRIATHPPLS